jgi:hypothetical protein
MIEGAPASCAVIRGSKVDPLMIFNATHALVGALPAALLAARLEREGLRRGARLAARWELDLAGFLNASSGDELVAMAAAQGLPRGSLGALRQRLWIWGCAHERQGLVDDALAPGLQPPAIVRGGRLTFRPRPRADAGVLPSARAARFPGASAWPRPVPARRAAPPPLAEPASLEELLARCDRLVGVRLGERGRDKGAYGLRLEGLLGLARSSQSRPDWRGEVECKSIAVVPGRGGSWRLKDGPALAMRGVDARAKCRRLLWIVRIDEGCVPGAPVLSWFYQELDVPLLHALEAARHLRPKGGKNTTARGWYLRRAYFTACGLLASLNGN